MRRDAIHCRLGRSFTVCTLVLLFALTAFSRSGSAMNFVIGDSNSQAGAGGTTSWSEEAFGDDVVNRSIGAASTYLYLNSCTDTCWWTTDATVDDTFWIMLGTADDRFDPETNVYDYIENMRAIFERIPTNDIRLISSPRVIPLNRAMNDMLNAQAFVDPLLCEENVRVTCTANPRDFLVYPLHYRDGVHLNDEGHRLLAAALVVPEPATGTLVGLGLVVLSRRRCARRRSCQRYQRPPTASSRNSQTTRTRGTSRRARCVTR